MKKILLLFVIVLLTMTFSACSHKHNYKEEIIKESTCNVKGEKKFTCLECNYSYVEEIPINEKHNYKSAVKNEASCSSDGMEKFSCVECGSSYEILIPGGHVFDNSGNSCIHCKFKFINIPKTPINIINYGADTSRKIVSGTIDTVSIKRDSNGNATKLVFSGEKSYDIDDTKYQKGYNELYFCYAILDPKGNMICQDTQLFFDAYHFISTDAYCVGDSYTVESYLPFEPIEGETYTLKIFEIWDYFGEKYVLK